MDKIDQEISTKIDSLFSFDNEDYEKLNIMDKGLGFHHKKNELKQGAGQKTSMKRKRTGIPLPKITEIKEVPLPTTLNHTGNTSKITSPIELTSIAKESNESNEKLNQVEIVYQSSSVEKVAFAWLVDFFVIATFLSAAVFLIFNISGISIGKPTEIILRADFLIFFTTFFVVFYFIYFTVLELLGTPGRMFFGTKLISTKNSGALHSGQTFLRALIIVTSPFLLLIPLYFGWHDKVSETRSVEEKW